MSSIVVTLNYWLGLGTIALLLSTAALFVLFAYEGLSKKQGIVSSFIARHALLLTAVLATLAAALTLVYSEIFGFLPCGLCWFERIALYPIAIVALVAFFVRDRVHAPLYLLALSGIGAAIALYHHYIQMGGSMLINCPISGADCAKRILFEFGFVTFPLMAFSLFAFIFVILLMQRRHTRYSA